MRKLIVGTENWEYVVGLAHVKIRSPKTGKSYIVGFSELTNFQEGSNPSVAITPSDVKDYIVKSIQN